MKKALVVLLALALVGGAFADAPVANLDVAEFTGSATVTWGVDLDTEKTGFKNETDASFKVNIVDGGEAATSSDNAVWGEIVVKTDGLSIEQGDIENGTASIDKAVLHLGPAYLGILADNTVYGAYAAPEAIKQYHETDKVGEDKTQGVVFGYDSDLFNVAVDFRSVASAGDVAKKFDADAYAAVMAALLLDENAKWKDSKGNEHTGSDDFAPTLFITDAVPAVSQYSNDYAIRAKLGLTPIEGLDVNVGFSYGFKSEVKGLGANVSYALPVGDFTVKPGLGYSTKLGDNEKGVLAIGLLFGFNAGDTGDDPVGLPYFGDDGVKKQGVSGVSVSTKLDLTPATLVIPLTVGLYTGDIVENLTAAFVLNSADVSKIGDNFEVAAALKYAAAVGDGTITPRAGVYVVNDASLKATVGAEFAGFVDNTTFDAVWESKNLSDDPAGKGTFNVSIKIAL